jgi:hypothetical protein
METFIETCEAEAEEESLSRKSIRLRGSISGEAHGDDDDATGYAKSGTCPSRIPEFWIS